MSTSKNTSRKKASGTVIEAGKCVVSFDAADVDACRTAEVMLSAWKMASALRAIYDEARNQLKHGEHDVKSLAASLEEIKILAGEYQD